MEAMEVMIDTSSPVEAITRPAKRRKSKNQRRRCKIGIKARIATRITEKRTMKVVLGQWRHMSSQEKAMKL